MRRVGLREEIENSGSDGIFLFDVSCAALPIHEGAEQVKG
jgi:hypothetical protein